MSIVPSSPPVGVRYTPRRRRHHYLYRSGQFVVYLLPKHSTRPGPRAKNLRPAQHGETYTYEVEKYWIVQDARSDGTLVLRTRTGKTRIVTQADPHLRPATWWERLRLRKRFPTSDDVTRGSGWADEKL